SAPGAVSLHDALPISAGGLCLALVVRAVVVGDVVALPAVSDREAGVAGLRVEAHEDVAAAGARVVGAIAERDGRIELDGLRGAQIGKHTSELQSPDHL